MILWKCVTTIEIYRKGIELILNWNVIEQISR